MQGSRTRQTRVQRTHGGKMPVVGKRRKRPDKEGDPLAAYRRIRKPMPPPEKVIRDRRKELDEEEARREMDER
jgi:hypothetical protein